MNNTSLRFGNIKISNAALLLFLLPLFFILSFITHLSHLNEINMYSGSQADYIIDAYYYIFLSTQVTEIMSSAGLSLHEASEILSPNDSTNGVVMLSSIVFLLFPDIVLIPFFFLFAYVILLFPFLAYGGSGLKIILILFSGLLPYLFIPSKESFFIIGFLIFLLPFKFSISKIFSFFILSLGISIMLLARTEAFLIMLLSGVALYLFNRKYLLILFLFFAILVYVYFLRDIAYITALAFQTSAESSGTSFCNVGFINTCITDKNTMELVFIQRILTIILLPAKWIYDFFISFGDIELLTVRNLLTRFCLLIQILWGYLAYKNIKQNGINIGLIFCIAYIFVYTTIFYYQFTRPIIFATTILFIFSSIDFYKKSNDSFE